MFRKLTAEEIQVRVSQISSKGCSLLLYKDARVDRAILDETFGAMNWQNDFKVIDSKMYGYVSIWDKEKNQWITKADCGVESNAEAEKGEASDCFKRGCFKWGIGIELYSAPFIWASVETEQYNGKWVLKDRFKKFYVKEIGYSDGGVINKLVIVDDKDGEVFKLGKKAKINNKNDVKIYAELGKIPTIEETKQYFQDNAENVNDVNYLREMCNEHIKALKKLEVA